MTTISSASPRLTAIVCLTLALVTLAAYWPVTRHEFIQYDDGEYITDNSHVNSGVSWANVVWAFTNKHAGNWHPLTWISHMLDCQMFGLKPAGHHLMNVLFHAANSLLLFLFLARTTGAFWRAAFVAAFFAWHPLRVESVAWAAERKDVLCGFFWMLTLLAWARYVTGDKCQVTRMSSLLSRVTCHLSLWYWSALLFFACALMSKPMAVTLPFILLLLDFWPLKRFTRFTFHVSGSNEPSTLNVQPSTQSVTRLVAEKLPFFALAFAVSAITFYVQKSSGAFWSLENLPVTERLANALAAYLGYISKIFWPVNLALIYPHPHRWPVVLTASSALLLLFWSGLVLWRARSRPYLFTGWFWFLGTLVPVIGLVQVGVQSMADRYTYLPVIGLLIAVVWGASDLCPQLAEKRLLAGLGAVALAGCLAATSMYLACWQNSLAVFSHAWAATTDNYAAEVCLGEALENAGRPSDALEFYTHAVRLEPRYPLAQFKLGMMQLAARQPDEAYVHLSAAAHLMPHDPDLQYDFGLLLRQRGDFADAIDRFRAALGDRPDFPAALNDLAWLLATVEDPKLRSGTEAVRLAQSACELTQNRQATLVTTLSAAYAETGRFPEAIATVQKALALARDAGQTNVAAQDEELLKLYQSGNPYRQTR